MGKTAPTRTQRLEWVNVVKMKVSQMAQRELNPHWVNQIVANFNEAALGTPTLNFRDGAWWIIDGQHRIEALRALGFDDTEIECWCYEGLTEQEEASKFLALNNRLTIPVFQKFRIGVEAGRPEEARINKIVQDAGLHVSLDKSEGAIYAVGTLTRVYQRDGEAVLYRALCVVRDTYGSSGYRAAVIEGVALLLARYGETLDDTRLVERLSVVHGGVNGLLGKAERLHQRMGGRRGHCVAAAAVQIYNSGKGGKLASWWKGSDD